MSKLQDPESGREQADQESGGGKVLAFKPKAKPAAVDADAEAAMRLMRVADDLDAVILSHLRSGTVDARDLAGLMAHRLGSLMRNIDRKDVLWDVCRHILEMQAALDDGNKAK